MTSPRRDDGTQWLGWRGLLLVFLFWTSLATVSSVNRLLDPRGYGLRVVSPAGPIALAYAESWIWAAFTPLIFWLSSRFSLGRSRWLLRVPVLIAIGIAISVSVSFLLEFARIEIFEVPRRGTISSFSPLRDFGRFRFINQLLEYFAILAAGFAREYFLRDQSRQREAIDLQAQTAMLQAQLADARLDALRMQLNPHFLFNTLHAVSALVERDPGGVRKMIARLSELLRHTIDSRADEVPLREELQFLGRYIEIMEIRFQGRLQVERRIAPDTTEALVPNLILQPIVENALEHGVSRLIGPGLLVLESRLDGDHLVLSVRDNGPGLVTGSAGAPVRKSESGVGLTNTRERLVQLYGDEASLTLAAAVEGGTIATITLPFHTANDLHAVGRNDE